VETWLVSQYGYDWDEVHDEAEVLEHALSDRLLATIDQQLGHPGRDPHGDPIPAEDGSVRVPDAVPLSELGNRERGVVARVSDRDAAVLRAVTAAGVRLDSEVSADSLPPDLADAVWVVRLP
jgi:DtxR family Mn-dependent transcriptional regulator